MWDIILESIRTGVIALIVGYLWVVGRKRGLHRQKGWTPLLAGWGLIFIGSLFDITDNFEGLNFLIIVGDTPAQAFIEKVVGFLFGFVLVAIGFMYWVPDGVRRLDLLKNDFISMVSHEIRTPLTSMTGSLGMVMDGTTGPIPKDAKEMIEIAQRNCDRLGRLVNDLLDLEKMDMGRVDFQMESIELNTLLRQAVEEHQAFGAKKNVSYRLQNPNEIMFSQIDSDRFRQVLDNLFSNAVKYSPPHQVVEVLLERRSETARIQVIDKGAGIPIEFQPYVFDKFSQFSSSGSAKEGSGLGLAIAKQFTEAMGCEIGFRSQPGSGTTFFLDLPLAIP